MHCNLTPKLGNKNIGNTVSHWWRNHKNCNNKIHKIILFSSKQQSYNILGCKFWSSWLYKFHEWLINYSKQNKTRYTSTATLNIMILQSLTTRSAHSDVQQLHKILHKHQQVLRRAMKNIHFLQDYIVLGMSPTLKLYSPLCTRTFKSIFIIVSIKVKVESDSILLCHPQSPRNWIKTKTGPTGR